MSKLIVMNPHDSESLDKALKAEVEVLLMQDAVLFANGSIEANNKLRDHKVYALESDVEKRGIKNRLLTFPTHSLTKLIARTKAFAFNTWTSCVGEARA